MGFVLAGQVALAQDLSHYRDYALGSSLDAVVAASGARLTDVKTIQERPATIQQLEWRAPYVDSRNANADPVRDITFRFYNQALYQVIVNYERDRTEGLTPADLVESLSVTYGAPVLAAAKTRAAPPPEAVLDSVILAQWESAESVVMLLRGRYSAEFQLTLASKSASTEARNAAREAARLDALDAPRREAEQRKKVSTDARDARDKTRAVNKAAFRP
jgi:hypothetical protein